eukprot:4913836-Ditylum_brightwellii.AAC.1
MQHVEKFEQLAEEQHGGMHSRTAGDATVLTALTTEIFTLQQFNTTITDCDVKVYFDRILPHFVKLRAHKIGLT